MDRQYRETHLHHAAVAGEGRARSKLREHARTMADALVAGGLRGALAGLTEASLLQLQGLGARASSGALIFLAGSAEIGVPIGALVALAFYAVRLLLPSGLWRGVEGRAIAGWIYGVGASLPFLAAAHFR